VRISVALCTCNGTAYLEEQLGSIAGQTRVPDELVVCDDCSGDGTVDLVRAFAGRASFPVRLHVNEEKLGSTRNFERAISLCAGEIIALCDQDDVWFLDKLARLERCFQDDPGTGLVVSNALLVNERLQPLGGSLWETIPFPVDEQDRAERGEGPLLLTRRNFVTGACTAFAASLRELLLPIPRCWIHDGWIGIVAAAVSGCRLIREPLLYYRQHPGQQLGTRPLTVWRQVQTAWRMDVGYFQRLAECFEEVRVRFAEIRPRLSQPGLPEIMSERTELARSQARMRSGNRLSRLRELIRQMLLGRYRRFGLGFLGWKSIAVDLFFY
jgi:glycosyltransferase involved in cell wall biosynthesis